MSKSVKEALKETFALAKLPDTLPGERLCLN